MLIPSLVHHKLRLNVKLTDEEEVQVRSAMSESFNKLEAVESKTARLRDRLILLNQRKKNTEHFIKLRQGLLAPIRRLHPEILQEIFCRCLPIAHNSVLSFEESPLLLGRVCSQWRQVAYSTPALWSSLHINTFPLTSPRARARLGSFDAWLARSGILPLSISMSTIMDHDMLSHGFRSYFDLIVKHIRRWKYVHLHVENLHQVDLPLEINAVDLPLLEVFSIRARDSTARSLLKKDCILAAPSLRILSVHESSLRLLELPVQWNMLTALDTAFSNLSDVFILLSLCSSLETCALSVGTLRHPPTIEDFSDTRPKVVLPQLRTLNIYGLQSSYNHDVLTILNNLFTPALRHFACHVAYLSSPIDSNPPLPEHLPWWRPFRSFFQRLTESLEELEFYDLGDETGCLMDILDLCPRLKRLLLRRSFHASDSAIRLFNDDLLMKLIPYGRRRHGQSCLLVQEPEGEQAELDGSALISPTCLCPDLEVLHIDGARFSKHVLLEFFNSRLVDYGKYGIAHLRRFNMSFDSEWDGDDMNREIDRLAQQSGSLVKLEHSSAPVPMHLLPPPDLHEDPFIEELPVF